ncbi:MAG: hypothetical protein JXR58_08330 [Bacteroidales bacterium]|nr:hypothetical protein [Bacteroidales bacterium]
MKILISAIFVCFVFYGKTQCFSSTGNPIGGNANMGVMNKNELRVASFFKHSYSGKYFHGTEISIDEGHNTANYAVYNYTSVLLGYGITDRFTVETNIGYYLNKTKYFKSPMEGNGFSNTELLAKYAFYENKEKRIEFTGKAGIKIPLRSSEQKLQTTGIDISKHPDVQSCLGNYGFITQIYLIKENNFKGLRYFFITQYEHNFWSKDEYFRLRQYNFGNSLNTSVFITKHLHLPPALSFLSENWTAILQVRHELKFQNKMRPLEFLPNGTWEYGDWDLVKNSGSNIIFICPQINYTIAKKWNLSVMADFPFYQNYNGIQLASNYAVAFNISRDINLNKKVEPELLN